MSLLRNSLPRLKLWLSRSIAHRIRFYALLLTGSMMLILGTTSYLALSASLLRNIDQRMTSEAAITTQNLSFLLNSVAKDLVGLSANTLLTNGLVDSTGRETYLTPFLRNHKNVVDIPVSLVLVDFQGEAVAANDTSSLHSYQRSAEVDRVLQQEYPVLKVVGMGKDAQLLFVLPIIFPPTQHTEGALVAKLNLNQLFLQGTQKIAKDFRVTLMSRGQLVIATAVEKGSSEITFHRAVPLISPFESSSFELLYAQNQATALSSLRWLAVGIVVAALLLLQMVSVIASKIANKLTAPLVRLDVAAARIAKEGRLDIEVLKVGDDEIGSLTESFNHMIHNLRSSYESLEQKVIDRTQSLQESEQRFRLMADNAPVMIWIAGTDKLYFWFNKVWLDFAGRTLSQEREAEWEDSMHPDDIQRCSTIYTEHFDLRQPFTMEYRFKRHDGEYRWLSDTGIARFSIDGSFEGYIGSCIDITERKEMELSLEKESEKNRMLLRNASDGIHILDVDGNVIEASDSFCTMLGYRREEVIGMNVTHWDAGFTNVTEQLSIITRQFEKNPARIEFETRHRRKDGTVFDVEVSGFPLILDGNTMLFFSSRDTTHRRLAEKNLQLAASVFSHAREGIFITDAAGTIIDVNDTFTDITGYKHDEAIGQNMRMLKAGQQGPEFYAEMWHVLSKRGQWRGEVWSQRKDGRVYAEQLTISAVHDAQGKTQNYVALFTDITHMKQQQQKLEHIAHYDILTNLPNRVLLADRLQQAMVQSLRRNQSLAVVFLDLDGFKAVNDQYGHDVGDELLIALALRIKLVLRDGDTLARIGGDEFVAILVDLEQAQDAEPILARLLQATSEKIMVGNAELQVSASIGVTFYPQDGADADQLMRHADQAMYKAKREGKNRYQMFDMALEDAIKVQRGDLERIQLALHQRELVLYYQPKVNMRTGAVVGAEALIRWQHPERGLLPPSAFLPIIENHLISVEVGEWVIDTALSQIAQWQAAGLDIPISVNISAYQLQKKHFTTRLSQILAAHPEVKPASLELEILETSALEDVIQISEIMRTCHAIGVRFALDDFGTGYSSLTYLKRLPADILKIDQSFVRDMLDDPDDLAIVDGVVGLATAFRRQVIAEGVETVAHGELLLPLGCELAQGYGIARPMPAADFPQWTSNWHPDPAWTVWRDRTPNRDDLAVVFAEVEHRHWLRALDTFVSGDMTTLPLGAHESHFVRWQEAEGLARYGDHPAFPVIVEMHERLRRLGQQLIQHSMAGEPLKAKALLDEMHGLSDEVIDALKGLVRGV